MCTPGYAALPARHRMAPAVPPKNEPHRTFQVGVASLTLPTLSVDIYTNGNWKVDLGFPDGDNWSVCFRVQAQAGPVPVTDSGGFYIASLSSAIALS